MFEDGAGEEGAEAGVVGMPPDEGRDEQGASAAAVEFRDLRAGSSRGRGRRAECASAGYRGAGIGFMELPSPA